MINTKTPNGADLLKKSIKEGSFDQLYIFCGEEDYLKRYYLNQMKSALVDKEFEEFNLIELDGKTLTVDSLTDAVEGCPAFSEHKLVIVSDFDLYKLPAAFQDTLPELLKDLPEYICLVFYYDLLPLKPDKRTKIHALLEKSACIADFGYLTEKELVAWVRRRVRALGKDIDQDNSAYLLFLCGTSMTNLITEIEKAAAHTSLDVIQRYNINEVCTPVLEAVIFDLTDAITAGKFDRAILTVQNLLAQKNTEVSIFSAILRHMQRLYAAKLNTQMRGTTKELMALIGSGSSFYAQKLNTAVKNLSLGWMRETIKICGKTDAALKSSAADKQKIIELALLQMAANFEGRHD